MELKPTLPMQCTLMAHMNLVCVTGNVSSNEQFVCFSEDNIFEKLLHGEIITLLDENISQAMIILLEVCPEIGKLWHDALNTSIPALFWNIPAVLVRVNKLQIMFGSTELQL